MVFDWRVMRRSAAVALVAGISVTGAMGVQAQEPGPRSGLPVDIHEGTCESPLAEPAYDAGLAEPVQETGETEAEDLVEEAEDAADDVDAPDVDLGVLGDDGILNQDDEGFFAEDLDGDGINDVGLDENGDGVLGDDEVVGADANNDGQLDENELVGAAPAEGGAATQIEETIYRADTDVDDLDTENLFATQHVVLVHESEENYTTYLACGEIRPLVEDDQIVVPLRPVGETDFFGVSLIDEDGSGAATFVLQGVQQQAAAAAPTAAPPPPTATPAPTETPAPPTPTPEPPPTETPVPPTETPIPTAVITETEIVEEEIVVTEVVESTEVVLAPTATAEASQ